MRGNARAHGSGSEDSGATQEWCCGVGWSLSGSGGAHGFAPLVIKMHAGLRG